MSDSALHTGYQLALDQHERLGAPTVVIPIRLPNGDPALYWESFTGLPEHITADNEMQSSMAVICCELAYDDAETEHDATPTW
jgi:hypothetical protein